MVFTTLLGSENIKMKKKIGNVRSSPFSYSILFDLIIFFLPWVYNNTLCPSVQHPPDPAYR